MRKAEASQRQITKAAHEAVAQQFLVLEPIFISYKFQGFQDITCPRWQFSGWGYEKNVMLDLC